MGDEKIQITDQVVPGQSADQPDKDNTSERVVEMKAAACIEALLS